MVIKIESKEFNEGNPIPKRYTCDDVNISPPLTWSSIPEEAKSIAIICEDPDAPGGTWSHWVIFNLPGDISGLDEFVMGREILDNGAVQGVNDFGTIGYGGPCPPSGTHRYYFKIYALDRKIEITSRINRSELLENMGGHIIDQGQLMGIYTR